MEPITLTESKAVVTVPAHHTVEYHDKNGNLFAKFDTPRPYDKVSLFTILEELLPVIATFFEHEPPAAAGHDDIDAPHAVTA